MKTIFVLFLCFLLFSTRFRDNLLSTGAAIKPHALRRLCTQKSWPCTSRCFFSFSSLSAWPRLKVPFATTPPLFPRRSLSIRIRCPKWTGSITAVSVKVRRLFCFFDLRIYENISDYHKHLGGCADLCLARHEKDKDIWSYILCPVKSTDGGKGVECRCFIQPPIDPTKPQF